MLRFYAWEWVLRLVYLAGDIIIDDTLIDIKATVKDKLQRNDFNQLLGQRLVTASN